MITKAATERKNRIQFSAEDFFCVCVIKLNFGEIKDSL